MRRHELDILSLVSGLLFVGVAVGHLLDVATGFDLDGRWIAPAVLVALGVAGLAGVLQNRDGEPAPAAADEDSPRVPGDESAGVTDAGGEATR